jgi:type VI secretion system secreted protein VgrG
LLLLTAFVAALQPAGNALAAPASLTLGTAASFSVLAGSTVTNTGTTLISADAGIGTERGNVGVSPGSAVTNFPPGIVAPPGEIHAADEVAAQAQLDLTAAYDAAAAPACDTNLTGQDLGGMTLVGGVYCFDSSAQLTGTLTLDAQGNPDAVFIFQIESTLTTSVGSTVLVINGAQACHLFWQVGSSATLGTGSAFSGNILALASITAGTAAVVEGRLLARNGAVTLDANTVHTPACAPQSGVSQTPLFGSAGLAVTLAVLLAAASLFAFRRRGTRAADVPRPATTPLTRFREGNI